MKCKWYQGNKQTNIALFIKLNFYFNKRVAGDLLS